MLSVDCMHLNAMPPIHLAQGVSEAGQAQAGELLQLWSGALHPKNASLCATAGGNNVQIWDLRSMACTGE